MKKLYLIAAVLLLSIRVCAQGHLSGDIMTNINFYDRDTAINASDNPLYDNYLNGGEAWLTLRYSYKGFTAFLRTDAYYNSNLLNPTQALRGVGIGAWSVSKDWENLSVTGGYIYDQIGSGILFRAYEDRGLLIDNALVGVRLKYDITDNIYFKAMAGQQKFLFTRYDPIIKAANAEGSFMLGDNVSIIPGVGVLNRTLDQTSIDAVVSTINSQDVATRFVPKYNMYAFTAYNTLTAGNISWYAEGAYKTEEAILKNDGLLHSAPGNVVFSTLSYARKGFAVNLTGKRTENFEMRTSPSEVLLRGMLNWQPIVARIRPQRLMARYTPASQNLSEIAGGGDILITPNMDLDISLNYTHINTLDDIKLYREAYAEATYRGLKNITFYGGVQYIEYNQEIYQVKPGVPIVKAITPFIEVTYSINENHSIRTEWEYMHTEQDYGSWIFGLLEYSISHKWSFAVSDMYTMDLNPLNPSGISKPQHYYNFFVAYNTGPHRFTAAYVKQVDGINCTGGVCRYEPAFSGVKLTFTSTF